MSPDKRTAQRFDIGKLPSNILEYLKAPRDLGVRFSSSGKVDMIPDSDATYASCKTDNRSVPGSITMQAGGGSVLALWDQALHQSYFMSCGLMLFCELHQGCYVLITCTWLHVAARTEEDRGARGQ